MSPGLPPIVPRKPEMDLMSVMVCGFYAFAVSASADSGRLWQMYGEIPRFLAIFTYFFCWSHRFFPANAVYVLRFTFFREIASILPAEKYRSVRGEDWKRQKDASFAIF